MASDTHDDIEHEAEKITRQPRRYSQLARRLTHLAGSRSWVISLGAFLAAWVLFGALIDFPRWWELVITVGFPLLTLALLALIQHTQNHDSNAIMLKLDELIASLDGPSDAMLRVEEASEHDLRRLQDHYESRQG